MAHLLQLQPSKTYKTQENAIKAFEAKFSNSPVRYIILQHTDGRYFPVAIGQEAIQHMVHFSFNVLG